MNLTSTVDFTMNIIKVVLQLQTIISSYVYIYNTSSTLWSPFKHFLILYPNSPQSPLKLKFSTTKILNFEIRFYRLISCYHRWQEKSPNAPQRHPRSSISVISLEPASHPLSKHWVFHPVWQCDLCVHSWRNHMCNCNLLHWKFPVEERCSWEWLLRI